MISIKKATSDVYYSQDTRIDYWTKGGEPSGIWFGSPLKELGLDVTVDRKDFRKLFNGLSPSGKPLVKNTRSKKVKPVHAFDLCFSVPKSLSILWALLPVTLRMMVQQVVLQAVRQALIDLEPVMIFTRKGAKGRDRVPGKMAAAIFEHAAARGDRPDPNLHFHVVVFNIAWTKNGTGTLDGRMLFRYKMLAGAIFRRHLANLIQERFGWKIRRDKTSFEVEGVPSELVKAFSTRSRQIRNFLAKAGSKTAKAAARAAKLTRPGKTKLKRPELFEEWAKRASDLGYPPDSFKSFVETATRQQETNAPHLLDQEVAVAALKPAIRAELHLILKKQAYILKRKMKVSALQATIELNVTHEQVFTALDEVLKSDSQLVRLNVDHPDEAISTKSNLYQEEELLEILGQLHDRSSIALDRDVIGQTVRSARSTSPDGFTHTQEQVKAIGQLLDHGDFKILHGKPGAGKTVTLKTMADTWKDQGYNVVGIALSGRAARNLHDKAEIPAFTIKRLTMELETNALTHSLRTINDIRWMLKGYESFERPRIDDKTILIVDEASQLDTRTALALAKAVQEANAKMIWVGDKHQLGSYEIGQPFDHAAELWKPALLTDIRRQEDPADIQAILDIARGQPELAIKSYQERQMISVAEDHEESVKRLIAEWKNAGGPEKPEAHQILVTSNKERIEINKQCQELCRAAGQLGSESISVGESAFHVGDQIMFLKNNKKLDVNNGDIGKVIDIDRNDNTMTVEVPDRKPIEVELSKYQEITHAFAVTIDKAQGSDYANTYLLLGGERESAELLYTGVSRHQESLTIFANEVSHGKDLSELITAMKPCCDPKLAIQMRGEPDDPIEPELTSLKKEASELDKPLSPESLPAKQPSAADPESVWPEKEIRPEEPATFDPLPLPEKVDPSPHPIELPKHPSSSPARKTIGDVPQEVVIEKPDESSPLPIADATPARVADDPADDMLIPDNRDLECAAPYVSVHETPALQSKQEATMVRASHDQAEEKSRLPSADEVREEIPRAKMSIADKALGNEHDAVHLPSPGPERFPVTEQHAEVSPDALLESRTIPKVRAEDQNFEVDAPKGPQDERVQKLMAECDQEVEQLKAMERIQKELAEREAERARALRLSEAVREMVPTLQQLTPGN